MRFKKQLITLAVLLTWLRLFTESRVLNKDDEHLLVKLRKKGGGSSGKVQGSKSVRAHLGKKESAFKFSRASSADEEDAVLFEYVFVHLFRTIRKSLRVLSGLIRVCGDTLAGVLSGVVKTTGGIFNLAANVFLLLSTHLEAYHNKQILLLSSNTSQPLPWVRASRNFLGDVSGKCSHGLSSSAALLRGVGEACIFTGDILESMTLGLGEALQDSFWGLEVVSNSSNSVVQYLLRIDHQHKPPTSPPARSTTTPAYGAPHNASSACHVPAEDIPNNSSRPSIPGPAERPVGLSEAQRSADSSADKVTPDSAPADLSFAANSSFHENGSREGAGNDAGEGSSGSPLDGAPTESGEDAAVPDEEDVDNAGGAASESDADRSGARSSVAIWESFRYLVHELPYVAVNEAQILCGIVVDVFSTMGSLSQQLAATMMEASELNARIDVPSQGPFFMLAMSATSLLSVLPFPNVRMRLATMVTFSSVLYVSFITTESMQRSRLIQQTAVTSVHALLQQQTQQHSRSAGRSQGLFLGNASSPSPRTAQKFRDTRRPSVEASSGQGDTGDAHMGAQVVFEDALWFNGVLLSLWEVLDGDFSTGGLGPYISDMYAEMVNAELAKIPPGVANARLKRFELGHSCPLLKGVRVTVTRNYTCIAEAVAADPFHEYASENSTFSGQSSPRFQEGGKAESEPEHAHAHASSPVGDSEQPYHVHNSSDSSEGIDSGIGSGSNESRGSNSSNGSSSGRSAARGNSSFSWEEEEGPRPHKGSTFGFLAGKTNFLNPDLYADRNLSQVLGSIFHFIQEKSTAINMNPLRKQSQQQQEEQPDDNSDRSGEVPIFLEQFSASCDRVVLDLDLVYASRDMDVVLSLRSNDLKSLVPEMTVTLSEVHLSGQLRLGLQLTPDYPFIGDAQVSFMQPPQMGFTLSSFGGLELSTVPYAYYWVNSTMHWLLEQYTTPNFVTLDLRHTICPSCDAITVVPPTFREVLIDAVRFLNATVAVAQTQLRDFALHVRADLQTIKERSLRDNTLQLLHCGQSFARWAVLKIRLVASRHGFHLGLGPPQEARTAQPEGQSSEAETSAAEGGSGSTGDSEGEEATEEEKQAQGV
ncbi:hypothetical protein B484DRAFT_477035 [Ochromonadaceae sp. CCMP2298]|nr:hypothetical protein B484DRAFT_477035 [Ochromonadaceae sp. CCMP2298]